MPPRGRRRRLWGGLPQGRGRPSSRGGADFWISLETREQGILLLGAVTVPGPRLARLAPSAGRGARGARPCARCSRGLAQLAHRHGHRRGLGHHGADQHPRAEGVARPTAFTRSHLGWRRNKLSNLWVVEEVSGEGAEAYSTYWRQVATLHSVSSRRILRPAGLIYWTAVIIAISVGRKFLPVGHREFYWTKKKRRIFVHLNLFMWKCLCFCDIGHDTTQSNSLYLQ